MGKHAYTAAYSALLNDDVWDDASGSNTGRRNYAQTASTAQKPAPTAIDIIKTRFPKILQSAVKMSIDEVTRRYGANAQLSITYQQAIKQLFTNFTAAIAKLQPPQQPTAASAAPKEQYIKAFGFQTGGPSSAQQSRAASVVSTEGVAKKYQAKDGGLNAKGRAHFKRTEGANLKPPVSAKAAKKSPAKAKRRKSFCARMEGQKKMHNIDCRANPDKDICKALRKWDC